MGLLSLIVFVVSCVAVSKASVCTSTLHGTCVSLLGGSCYSGYHLSLSYCGFLELCCYKGSTSSSSSQTGSSGSSTHTGSSGTPTQTTKAPSPSINTNSHRNCGVSTVNDPHRIVGGTTATSHEYPWQVSLMYGGHHMCGGTLIDSQWVLTAAHCFEDTYHSYWTVGVGIHDRSHIYTSQVHRTSAVIVHQRYVSKQNQNDIALVKLDKPIDVTRSSSTRAACLPTTNESFENLQCTVTGWGSTHSGGNGQRYLHEVDVPIISNSLCQYYLGRNVVYNTNICAGYSQGGHDACQGDSGGPLTCKKNGVWQLAGIVSWGYGCGQRYAPGVYTRVSSYIDWINQQKAAH